MKIVLLVAAWVSGVLALVLALIAVPPIVASQFLFIPPMTAYAMGLWSAALAFGFGYGVLSRLDEIRDRLPGTVAPPADRDRLEPTLRPQ